MKINKFAKWHLIIMLVNLILSTLIILLIISEIDYYIIDKVLVLIVLGFCTGSSFESFWKNLEKSQPIPEYEIKAHLQEELQQLDDTFYNNWNKHGDEWKKLPFHELIQRLHQELDELMDAQSGTTAAIEDNRLKVWTQIRDESLDCSLVSLMITHRANARIELMQEAYSMLSKECD